jgi:hypothetical protein
MITIHAGGYRAVVLELNTGSRGLRVRSDPLDGGRACKPLHTVACVDVPCHPALLCPDLEVQTVMAPLMRSLLPWDERVVGSKPFSHPNCL